MATTKPKSPAPTISRKLLESLRKQAQFKKGVTESEKLKVQYYTYKTLTDAKKQVVSANHNLKIVLDELSKQVGKKPRPLDSELNKAIGHALVFLRSAHNSIKKMGTECGYSFSHEPLAKSEQRKEKCEELLADLVEARKKYK